MGKKGCTPNGRTFEIILGGLCLNNRVEEAREILREEYYTRQINGSTLEREAEKRRISQCLTAAVERRISHGLRLDVRTRNRSSLLADMTRVFRENGMSVARIEISTHGENASGVFYVTDSTEHAVIPNIVETLRTKWALRLWRLTDPRCGGCPRTRKGMAPERNPDYGWAACFGCIWRGGLLTSDP